MSAGIPRLSGLVVSNSQIFVRGQLESCEFHQSRLGTPYRRVLGTKSAASNNKIVTIGPRAQACIRTRPEGDDLLRCLAQGLLETLEPDSRAGFPAIPSSVFKGQTQFIVSLFTPARGLASLSTVARASARFDEAAGRKVRCGQGHWTAELPAKDGTQKRAAPEGAALTLINRGLRVPGPSDRSSEAEELQASAVGINQTLFKRSRLLLFDGGGPPCRG